MVQIEGAYKLEKNENLEEFYESFGVALLLRNSICALSPTIYVIKGDQEKWVFKTVTSYRTNEVSFKLNEVYDETTESGEEYQSITEMQGDNTFVTVSNSVRERPFMTRYEFSDDGLVMTLNAAGCPHEAKRYFKRTQ